MKITRIPALIVSAFSTNPQSAKGALNLPEIAHASFILLRYDD
jgi:hypothetical protein